MKEATFIYSLHMRRTVKPLNQDFMVRKEHLFYQREKIVKTTESKYRTNKNLLRNPWLKIKLKYNDLKKTR